MTISKGTRVSLLPLTLEGRDLSDTEVIQNTRHYTVKYTLIEDVIGTETYLIVRTNKATQVFVKNGMVDGMEKLVAIGENEIGLFYYSKERQGYVLIKSEGTSKFASVFK
jgi:hypothetical protein